MKRNVSLLVLFLLVALISAAPAVVAEVRATFSPEVWEDEERGVVCYSLVSPSGGSTALSCLPLETTIDTTEGDGNEDS